MIKTLLVQLPIPKHNLGLQTGNVPLAAASLKQAVKDKERVDFIPESIISYLGDNAVIDLILDYDADIIGFSLFSWNVDRSIYLAEKLKELGKRIIFGGPEAATGNDKVFNSCADFVIKGEGEALFSKFINPEFSKDIVNDCLIFMENSSPYVDGLLEPEIQDSMLLETQRGCPYSCGYCYYNKSRSKLCFKPLNRVYEGIEYGIDKNISEIYLLDPSLNTRADLKKMLLKIGDLNKEKKVFFHSEIRAESINKEMADLFKKAGFASFEIGLQSTNPKALSVMKRPTDLGKFLNGVNLLKERGISPCVDLIAGLPGDNPKGLKKSIDFIYENDLTDEVQFFPLSVIPGTDFRLNHKKLALKFNPDPPYNIISTNDFTTEDIMESFEYAEECFELSFFPMPDIDLSYKTFDLSGDVFVKIGDKKYISKVKIFEKRDLNEIENLSKLLTQPYQILIGENVNDTDYILKLIEIVTKNNPFSPLEIVFFDPVKKLSQGILLNHCFIKKPHFLDGDLRYLYPGEGNRAVIFTIASSKNRYNYSGEMEREVFIWKDKRLPEIDELTSMGDYDGLLIDSSIDHEVIEEWQDMVEPYYENLIHICFADLRLQIRWIKNVFSETYYSSFFDNCLPD